MNNSLPASPPQNEILPPSGAIVVPTMATHESFWAARRRRPVFLVMLVAGLALFLFYLPAGARASLWVGLSAQRGLVILLTLFALLTMSLVWSAGQRLDVRVFILFNTRRYPAWLDRFMWLVTQLGNMVAACVAAGLLFIFNYRRMAIEIIFGTLLLWVLVETIKALSDRDRPFLALENTRVIGWKERGDSFPSGHTTQVFFLTALFIHRFQLGIGISLALYAVAVMVGLTRIYVGAHYPRDVVAGVVLGSVWAILTMLVNPY